MNRLIHPLVFALLLGGCDDSTLPITAVRERPRSTTFESASTAERFGAGPGRSQGNPHAGMKGAPEPQHETRYEAALPRGWEEVAPTENRRRNFRVTRDPDTECYLTVLSGAGGGIGANVNRWRKQMGLDPAAPADLARLPQEVFFEKTAFLVDLEGTYAGMGQEPARPGYRMLGLIQEQPGQTVFLKMTGPAATVAEERARFLELARSFRAVEAPRETGEAKWYLPEGWEMRPEQPQRVVTIGPRGSPDTECYVTILGGTVMGVEANLSRWRTQMGQAPLAPGEISSLRTLRVLGQEVRMLEVTGPLSDMQGKEKIKDAALLGVVCPLEGAMLFLKMTGPKDVVLREKEHFVAFCESLRND